MKRTKHAASSTEAEDTSRRPNRRRALALGGAAVAAAAVAALGANGGKKAQAAAGENFILGQGNDSGTVGSGLEADVNGTTLTVDNWSTGSVAAAIHGQSASSWGVIGSSPGTGVKGVSLGNGPGVYGDSPSAYGVAGEGGAIGVYGFSPVDGVVGGSVSGRGVWGFSSSSFGVHGGSDNGHGVYGTSLSGAGVKGQGKVGVRGIGHDVSGSMGVHAKNSATKAALRTQGRVKMDCARTKSLANKANLVTLPSGVNIGSTVIVLATMQGSPGNDALIKRAYRVDSKHIRIVFNRKPARSTKVGYWVVHTG